MKCHSAITKDHNGRISYFCLFNVLDELVTPQIRTITLLSPPSSLLPTKAPTVVDQNAVAWLAGVSPGVDTRYLHSTVRSLKFLHFLCIHDYGPSITVYAKDVVGILSRSTSIQVRRDLSHFISGKNSRAHLCPSKDLSLSMSQTSRHASSIG